MSGNSLISEGIKDILVENGIGVFLPQASETDWGISISRLRPKPVKMIAVFDSGGRAPEPGLDINYPSIQLIIRGDSDGYVAAHAKARRCRDVLLGRRSETRGGDIWASITMTSDIIPLAYDDNERPQLSMNFALIVHQGDLTYSWRQDTGGAGGSEMLSAVRELMGPTVWNVGVADSLLLCDCINGNCSINLPYVINTRGLKIIIKKVDNSLNTVIINPSSDQFIENQANWTLRDQHENITIQSTGLKWVILGSYNL
jgi:Bacteriophage minor capsid protein